MRYPIVCLLYCTTKCDHNCVHCLVRDAKPVTLDYDKAAKNLSEFKNLGGRYVDFTGGNPLLMPGLEDLLRVSRKLGLISSLTLSGPQIRAKGEKIFSLPDILRISIEGDENYHNGNRGQNCYSFIKEGLEMAKRRGRGQTQLIFTVIPGSQGNLNRDQFAHVLQIAREFQVIVNINPIFNIGVLSGEELQDLKWFARQADVQCSRGKLRFILRGGNNTCRPTCRAAHNTITISADNELILPCYHHRAERISLPEGLKVALDSPIRKNLLSRDGRFDFCEGCSIWCYIIPSWFSHVFDRVAVWEHGLSGLQPLRDAVLRYCGRFHHRPYPDLSF